MVPQNGFNPDSFRVHGISHIPRPRDLSLSKLEDVTPLMLALRDASRHLPPGRLAVCIGGDHDPDDGLVVRTGAQRPGEDSNHDTKTFFHHKGPGRWLTVRHELNQRNGVPLRELDALTSALDPLYTALACQAKGIAEQLEKRYPSLNDLGDGETKFSQRVLFGAHVLRVLLYEGENPGEAGALADTHCDRSGFTIQVHETAPGLECLTGPNRILAWKNGVGYPDTAWQPIACNGLLMPVFPGLKLAPVIPATPHRVMGTPGAVRPSPETRRASIIFFAHPYGIELPAGAKTH